MKGRNPTAEQKRFWDMLSQRIGCVACAMDGNFNDYTAVHHVDGRTKSMAHWQVLPLCAGHHQDGTGAKGLIAVHPWKTQFEDRYGKQMDLLVWCIEQLQLQGLEVPDGALRAAGMLEVA
ncbi:Ref family recombination enhancement nuclease [Achromobacter ruhlandii]|uniref:Ref family recombination enhancement nuclease n=1 Tax=Achromobacter ruhlandii TaxID=72557 RepID=UPI003B9F68EE